MSPAARIRAGDVHRLMTLIPMWWWSQKREAHIWRIYGGDRLDHSPGDSKHTSNFGWMWRGILYGARSRWLSEVELVSGAKKRRIRCPQCVSERGPRCHRRMMKKWRFGANDSRLMNSLDVKRQKLWYHPLTLEEIDSSAISEKRKNGRIIFLRVRLKSRSCRRGEGTNCEWVHRRTGVSSGLAGQPRGQRGHSS